MATYKWQQTNNNLLKNGLTTSTTKTNPLTPYISLLNSSSNNNSALGSTVSTNALAPYTNLYTGNSSVNKTGNLTVMNGTSTGNSEGVTGNTSLSNDTFTNYTPNSLSTPTNQQTGSLSPYLDKANKATDTTIEPTNNTLTSLEKEQADTNAYYDQQVQYLLSQYQNAKEELDNSRRQSQQGASITLDKLKKYLPTQIKNQGLGGLGVSETSALQAYNNYANNMGSIENNYQTNLNDIENNKNSTTMELENYRRAALLSDKTNAETAELNNMNYAQSVIEQSPATTLDEMLKYIEGYKGSLSEENYQKLVDYATVKAESNLNALKSADKDAAQQVVNDTISGLVGSSGYNAALEYLESNKDIFGEATYQAMYNQLLKYGVEEISNTLNEFDEANNPQGALEYLEDNQNLFNSSEENKKLYQELYDKYTAKVSASSTTSGGVGSGFGGGGIRGRESVVSSISGGGRGR